MSQLDSAPASGPELLGHYDDTDWDITSGVGYTALAVAAGRAMETQRPDGLIADPQAQPFVAAAEAAGSDVALPTEWPPNTSSHAIGGVDPDEQGRLWRTLTSYMGVRSRFFDQTLQQACRDAGVRQVVLLAAGLDTRAHRLQWPAGTRVFEIDHPNVLAFKDRVLTQQGSQPSCERRAVQADLREDWPTALREAGFDPGSPTAWLAEGLLPFLPDEAKQGLCQRVQELSAHGSVWAIETFADPGAASGVLNDDALLQRMGALFGADPTGLWPPEQRWQPHDWLVRQGWTVTGASAHTVAARYQRVLDGAVPMANPQHPGMLLAATYEDPKRTSSDA